MKLADGYQTESGRPLDEAGKREFIQKPDGSKDFGEISPKVSEAVKEQTGEDLKPGKIRMRVGNKFEGLIHAKAHEAEAKQDGYDSIENMIDDVAQNFDRIYKRDPDTPNGKATYSLVKTVIKPPAR